MFSVGARSKRNKRTRVSSGGRGGVCPYCGKRGFYNVSRKYERCQCCGLYRVLLPERDA